MNPKMLTISAVLSLSGRSQNTRPTDAIPIAVSATIAIKGARTDAGAAAALNFTSSSAISAPNVMPSRCPPHLGEPRPPGRGFLVLRLLGQHHLGAVRERRRPDRRQPRTPRRREHRGVRATLPDPVLIAPQSLGHRGRPLVPQIARVARVPDHHAACLLYTS